MNDKLTDEEIDAIRVKYHPDQLYALYAGAGVDANDYHTKRSVDAHYTDIPALLAHIRALEEEHRTARAVQTVAT